MTRPAFWIGGGGLLLAGFLAGRAVAPTRPVEFPKADETYSADQMASEVGRALREPRAFPRAVALTRLFEGLSPENVDGASRAVAARTGIYDPVDLQLFLTAWIHLDPVAAMAEVQSWPIRSQRELGFRTVMREWAASGKQLEAANFFETLTDPDQRRLAAGPLVRGWALTGDFDGAVALTRRLWEAESRQDVVDGLMRGVLQAEGPEGLLERARSLDPFSEGPFARRAARVAMTLAAREAPAAAAAYYDELAREGAPPWLDGMVDKLAALQRNRDPRAALEWLLRKPESPERGKALRETMGTWAIRDSEAAWAWFRESRSVDPEATGPLEGTDAFLVAGLVRRLARTDPADASRWAARLPREADRVGMLRRVAYFWSEQDPAAADAWIAGLTLSTAERKQVEESAGWGRSEDSEKRGPAFGQETEELPALAEEQ